MGIRARRDRDRGRPLAGRAGRARTARPRRVRRERAAEQHIPPHPRSGAHDVRRVARRVRLARRHLIDRADAAVGDAVEALVRSHHRRRLERTGRGSALEASDGLWAAGEPPPRSGNELEIVVDGANALPRIAAELERAESSVWIAGWYVSTELALVRGRDRVVLLDLLEELARR